MQALQLAQALQSPQEIAFNTVKLGQVAQARGDLTGALAKFDQGLAIFERLGMPEAAQVQQIMANLQATGTQPHAAAVNTPLEQALQQAHAAKARGDLNAAIAHQEQAVAILRASGKAHQTLVNLSVLLYNLAGDYGKTGQHHAAVQALQEVVALDEQTNHPDLELDRQTLAAAQQMAASHVAPESHAAQDPNPDDFEAQIAALLNQVPPEQRAALQAQVRQAWHTFQQLSPAEQTALLQSAQATQSAQTGMSHEQAAQHASDAALAALHQHAPRNDVLAFLENLAKQAAEGEAPGSIWLEVAALCQALIALLRREPLPPIPTRYAAHFAAVQAELP